MREAKSRGLKEVFAEGFAQEYDMNFCKVRMKLILEDVARRYGSALLQPVTNIPANHRAQVFLKRIIGRDVCVTILAGCIPPCETQKPAPSD